MVFLCPVSGDCLVIVWCLPGQCRVLVRCLAGACMVIVRRCDKARMLSGWRLPFRVADCMLAHALFADGFYAGCLPCACVSVPSTGSLPVTVMRCVYVGRVCCRWFVGLLLPVVYRALGGLLPRGGR